MAELTQERLDAALDGCKRAANEAVCAHRAHAAPHLLRV
jgi:hypothetical protein